MTFPKAFLSLVLTLAMLAGGSVRADSSEVKNTAETAARHFDRALTTSPGLKKAVREMQRIGFTHKGHTTAAFLGGSSGSEGEKGTYFVSTPYSTKANGQDISLVVAGIVSIDSKAEEHPVSVKKVLIRNELINLVYPRPSR